MKTAQLLVVGLLTLFIGACASSNSGSVYSREEARKVQTVRTGIVESVRQVRIEGTKTAIGPAAGAAVGGIAGSTVGNDTTGAVVAVIGAVVGGLAGAAAEEGITQKDGLEITVKLDGGGLIAVVQEADVPFKTGDTVRLVELNGVTRATH